ncbi:BioY family protein [Gordonia effusa NBRC 100432]|uniref:Biotin transporter n=1 Tax=Gordonia effusa NBRC 100432 TaxID=1077974 RepID=H0R273_9ACTN|nr:biotin transporter BioY [Gordonia effusa]GAB19174.1 BioY family protein [Gordonia effusa NBRC 100432]
MAARTRPGISVTDVTQAAVFAALIAVLGLPGTINIGSSGVPITLQTMGVMLAGAILGPRKGTLAVVIFIVLAIVGLPILAGGRNGQIALSSPTAGYFIGFLPAVIFIGLATSVIMPRYRLVWGFVINVVGGMGIAYLCGAVGVMIRTDSTFGAALALNGTYVIGDLLKAAVTAVVAQQVHRGYPGLITPIRLRRKVSAAAKPEAATE